MNREEDTLKYLQYAHNLQILDYGRINETYQRARISPEQFNKLREDCSCYDLDNLGNLKVLTPYGYILIQS